MSKPSQFMVTSDLPVRSSRSARLRPHVDGSNERAAVL